MRHHGSKTICLYRTLLVIGLVFLFLFASCVVFLESPALLARDREDEGQTGDLAVLLLIDISGSMARTDPDRLRETASGMLIDLLGDEDYLGVIAFDHEAEWITPLQPLQDTATREKLKSDLSPRLEPRGSTDFLGALEEAGQRLDSHHLEGRRPVILMLTDGEPNPDPSRLAEAGFMEEYLATLWDTVLRLGREGAPVYTVGFSDEIDPQVLRRMARESRGESYITTEAYQLPVTFFELLGDLKTSRVFLDETVEMDGTTRNFTFEVDEYTRQVNFIAVNHNGEVEMTVKPPGGAGSAGDNLLITEGERYVTVVLNQPEKGQQGKWKVEIRSRGEVKIMGNAEQNFSASLVEPVPYSQHPLHEPLEIKAELDLREEVADVDTPFHLEIHLVEPESRSPEVVALKKDSEAEEGVYRGIYEPVNKQGEHRLQLRVLSEGELLFATGSTFYAERIPHLATDFWVEDRVFQVGEEVVATASLQAGGTRLREGGVLEVEEFYLFIDYLEAGQVEIPLYDSGSPEHGDARAGDGIWSNRVTFEEEGGGQARLFAGGTYRGTDFFLEKPLNSFNVMPPGTLSIERGSGNPNPWSAAGGSFTLPLRVESSSPVEQTLKVTLSGQEARLEQERWRVPPGIDREGNLKLNLPLGITEKAEEGIMDLSLGFAAEDGLTGVHPESLDFQLEVLSPGAAFLRSFQDFFSRVLWFALFGIIAGGIFFLGGVALNRFYLLPRLNVGGVLECRRVGGEGFQGDGSSYVLKLHKIKKQEVVISFNSLNSAADFRLENPSFHYDIIIKNRWHEPLTSFLRGWKALLDRSVNPVTLVECTPPGVLVSGDTASTRKELYHDDEFETGGYLFRYSHVYGKWHKQTGDGVNVLEGRV